MKITAEQLRRQNRRAIFIYRFSIVAIIASGTIGLAHLIQKDTVNGLFDLIIALVAGFNLLEYRVTKQSRAAVTVIIVGLLVAMPYFVLTGGLDNSGIAWLFMFPPIVYFLSGRRVGSYLVLTLTAIILALMAAQSAGTLRTAYQLAFLRQTLVAFVAVSMVIFFYEVVNEEDSRLAEERYVQLRDANEELSRESDQRKKDAEVLTTKSQELEKLNQLMIGRELKMIELKERLSSQEEAKK